MENNKETIWPIILVPVVLILCILFAIKPERVAAPTGVIARKEDSLQMIINQLQIDIEAKEIEWDKREKHYGDIIYEYEYGVDYLKHYHSIAYKDFHRVIGYKEYFTYELEKENKRRISPKF